MPTSYEQHLVAQAAAIREATDKVASYCVGREELYRVMLELKRVMRYLESYDRALFNIVGNGVLGSYTTTHVGLADEERARKTRARILAVRAESIAMVRSKSRRAHRRLARAMSRVDAMVTRVPECAGAMGRLLGYLHPHTVPRY